MFTESYINEIWKPVRGYEGWYEVSNFGRVKSLHWHRSNKEKILKPKNDTSGYLMITLCRNGIVKYFRAHRLVWEAFYGLIPEGYEINHINEDKTDNRLENLNLMTPKENINWGTHNARMAAALTNHPNTSKPVLQFAKDGTLIKEYSSVMEAWRQTGVSYGNISNCCRSRIVKRGKYYCKCHSAGGFIWRYAN